MADIRQFTTRGFEEQFASETVNRISHLLERIAKLNYLGGVSRFYASDLSLCLRGGALLGALHVASSLLEIVVRERFVQRCTEMLSDKERKTRNLQIELEDCKKLDFHKLVETLKKAEVFKPDDANKAHEFYNTVRIPVHHGLPVRFVEKNTDLLAEAQLLMEIFGKKPSIHDSGVGFHYFEKAIEQSSLSLIETAIGLIERNFK